VIIEYPSRRTKPSLQMPLIPPAPPPFAAELDGVTGGGQALAMMWPPLRVTLYHRVPRLLQELALARADGRYARTLRQIARVNLLIPDDWGPEALTAEQRRDLLEIIEDRYDRGSILVTSQLPVDRWYEIIGNPTIADAILDRLVHNAYRIELKGEIMRKKKTPETPPSAA
jgi:hypothetical protein